MLQAMHASNARKQCRYETNVTNGLRSGLSSRDILTFRNARAHIRNSRLELVRERIDGQGVTA